MLERESAEKGKCFDNGFIKNQSQTALEDLVLSMSHRLSLVEAGLNSKIDRSQCMLILESKANFSHIKRIVQEISSKFEKERNVAQEKLVEQQKQSKKQMQKLRQKLKCKKKEQKRNVVQKNIMSIKPQQLYLQSNQTMFSIIVDQISALKQSQLIFERSLEQRNKVAISLNNQVCSKIQTLERQIETSLKSLKTIKDIRKQSILEESRQSWSNSEQMQSRAKQVSKSNFHKTDLNNKTCSQLHQTSHILRTIQSLQKDIATKINIKDVLPIIKKNMQPLTISIDEIRKYCQEAIESTKKILINQSEINQQLCAVSKMGWWHSFQERSGLAVWNKQIANLVPEIFGFARDSNEIELVQQGTYIIKLLTSGDELPQTIIVGNEEIQIIGQSLIKVDKNTVIQVPSSGGQIFLTILKI